MKPMPKYCISKWRQWGLGQPENIKWNGASPTPYWPTGFANIFRLPIRTTHRQPENLFTSNSASESVSSSARALLPCARNPPRRTHRTHRRGKRRHNRPQYCATAFSHGCNRRHRNGKHPRNRPRRCKCAFSHRRNGTHRAHRNGMHQARPNRTNRNRPHPSSPHRRARNRRAGNTPCRLLVLSRGQAFERGRNNACRQNGNAPSAGATGGSLKTRHTAESNDSPRPSSRSRHTPSDRRN